MKYWAYVNNEVMGPFEQNKLADVPGITSETMVCPDISTEDGKQKWQPFGTLQEDKTSDKQDKDAEAKKEYIGFDAETSKDKDTKGFQSPWNDPASASKSDDVGRITEIKLPDTDEHGEEKIQNTHKKEQTQFKISENKPDIFDSEKPATQAFKPIKEETDIFAEKEIGDNFSGIGEKKSINNGFDTDDESSYGSTDNRIKSMEDSISKLTSAMESISEKLNSNQKSIDEIKNKIANMYSDAFAAEQMPQVDLGKTRDASVEKFDRNIEKALKEESKIKIQTGNAKTLRETQSKQKKPAKTEVILNTKAKSSFPVKMIKVFFVLVFILILTSGVFVFLVNKGILPDFLNPLNYVLPPMESGQPPSAEMVSSPPEQAVLLSVLDEESMQVLSEVREFKLTSGKSLNQAIIGAHLGLDPETIDWNVQKIDSGLFSIIVKIPPTSQNDYVISYRFDYNRAEDNSSSEKMLIPTNSEAQNILDK